LPPIPWTRPIANAWWGVRARRGGWTCVCSWGWPRPPRASSETARGAIPTPTATSALCPAGSGREGWESSVRRPDPKRARGGAGARGEAEGSRRAGGALPGAGDQGRDGREVIGVGRVAEAEHDRDEADERERRAVGERGDPAVESEHGQLTFGTARRVMASPAARMTSALAAGKSRTSGPSKLTRRKRRRVRAAARPIPG